MSQLEERVAQLKEKAPHLSLVEFASNKDAPHVFKCLACHTRFSRPLSKVLNRNQAACTNPSCEHSRSARQVRHGESKRTSWVLPEGVKMLKQASSVGISELECSCGVTLYKSIGNFSRRSTDLWCHNPSCSHFNTKFQTVDAIRELFIERGTKPLFDSYQNPDTPLDFICRCGQTGTTNYRFLLKANRHGISHPPTCDSCKNANRPRGENSPTWNPEITQEQREKERRVWGAEGESYVEWRRSVHIRDKGRCVITGARSTPQDPIRVHHVFNYRHYPEGRTLTCNGVCLSQSLHRKFHSEYGAGDTPNTLAQFQEFYIAQTGTPYINQELESAALQYGWYNG